MLIKPFTSFIAEGSNNSSQVTTMTHLEHIEDYIFNQGQAGINQLVKFLEYMFDVMKGESDHKVITQSKWDGSPSVVAGVDPESGRFFVTTKSAFNKEPVLLFSEREIDRKYSDKPDLADKLKYCFLYLPEVIGDKIIQGDLLFTDADKKVETIEGEQYITFRANTLTFAVPTNTPLAKKIDSAKLGIVFHVTYDGDSIENIKANFKIKKSMFTEHPDVWWNTSTYEDLSGNVFFTQQESLKYHSIVDKIISIRINPELLDCLVENQVMIKSYNNRRITTIDNPFEDVKEVVNGLLGFMKEKFEQEIAKIKTETTKNVKREKFDKVFNTLVEHKGDLIRVYYMINLITAAKNMIINKLEDLRDTKFFIETPDGYKVTKSEGFVVADKLSDYVVKLVDRTEFSRNNFIMSKNRAQANVKV